MHTWKQGTAKVRTENSLCNREFKFHTCLEPGLPQELRQLCYSELKILKSFFFLVIERGGKRTKIDYFRLKLGLFGEYWELSVLCPRASSNEVTPGGSPGLPILSQHLVDVYPLFPLGSAALWDQLPLQGLTEGNSRGRSGNADQLGSRWSLHRIYCTCSHLGASSGTKNWCSGSHKHIFVPTVRKPPNPPPQNKFTGIKSIIIVQNEPELWYAECVPSQLRKGLWNIST